MHQVGCTALRSTSSPSGLTPSGPAPPPPSLGCPLPGWARDQVGRQVGQGGAQRVARALGRGLRRGRGVPKVHRQGELAGPGVGRGGGEQPRSQHHTPPCVPQPISLAALKRFARLLPLRTTTAPRLHPPRSGRSACTRAAAWSNGETSGPRRSAMARAQSTARCGRWLLSTEMQWEVQRGAQGRGNGVDACQRQGCIMHLGMGGC